MPKFRKRPIVIEAEKFTGDNGQAVLAWMDHPEAFWSMSPSDASQPQGLFIPTTEGILHASPGDWIIRGVQNELYPCKPDIFDATYEPV